MFSRKNTATRRGDGRVADEEDEEEEQEDESASVCGGGGQVEVETEMAISPSQTQVDNSTFDLGSFTRFEPNKIMGRHKDTFYGTHGDL